MVSGVYAKKKLFLQILSRLHLIFDCPTFRVLYSVHIHGQTKMSHVQQLIVITHIYIHPLR